MKVSSRVLAPRKRHRRSRRSLGGHEHDKPLREKAAFAGPGSSSERSEQWSGTPALAKLMIALAVAAFAAAYLAAILAIGGGKASLTQGVYTNVDQTIPWLMYRSAIGLSQHPLEAFRPTVAQFYFPDMLFLWLMYLLGVGYEWANILVAIPLALISIGGWFAVSAELFGPKHIRLAWILFAHALMFLGTAASHTDVYVLQMLHSSHYGTWACVPWILFLAFRALAAGKATPYIWLVALATLQALVTVSDLVVVSWILAPMLFSLAAVFLPQSPLRSLCRIGEGAGIRVLLTGGSICVGTIAGYIIGKTLPFEPNRNTGDFLSIDLAGFGSTLTTLASELAQIIARNPVSSAVWLSFVILALWRLLNLFFPAQKGLALTATKLFGVPTAANHVLLALFMPAAAGAALVAVVATGNVGTAGYQFNMGPTMRHMLPLLFFPLFAGWTLLPWENASLAKRAMMINVAASACVFLFASAKAIAGYDGLGKLDSFASPFQQCFASNAKKLGWTGGIGTFLFYPLIARPDTDIDRYLIVGVLRRKGIRESQLYLDWTLGNRHWFSGEFQFVVINGFNDRLLIRPPADASSSSCSIKEYYECLPRGHTALIMDSQAAIGAFGEPHSVVSCAGLSFFHYDPPIRLDHSGIKNPDLQRVGDKF